MKAEKNHCGRRVRELRIAAKIEQAGLGKAVRLGRDAIAKIESGVRCVTDIELVALSVALQCTVEQLLRNEKHTCFVAPVVNLHHQGQPPSVVPWEVLSAVKSYAHFRVGSPAREDLETKLRSLSATDAQLSTILALGGLVKAGASLLDSLAAASAVLDIELDGSCEVMCKDLLARCDHPAGGWIVPMSGKSYSSLPQFLEAAVIG